MTLPQSRRTPCNACPLKKLEVFRVISPEELAFVDAFKSGEFAAEPGATILAEGSSSPHLFTVLTGWAFRYKLLPDGRRQILNFALPGDFIGLQGSMFNEMQHSVEALTPMVLCVFPRDKLWSLYSKHPALAYDLTWLASRNETLLDENLLSVGRRTAAERVAFVLLDLFTRGRQLGMVQGHKMKFAFTQQHLADALGLSLVHTNKTLKALAGRKLVRWSGATFELLDEGKLIELAKYEALSPPLRPLI
jgi:CRP/FNR family transcriptional regulator, anaerobic regulatory protein